MLERSFLHIRGIGRKRERSIWLNGVASWHDALQSDLAFLGALAPAVKAAAAESIERLRSRDCAFFADRLPAAERWRVWTAFRSDCCYLDIETDPYRPILVGLLRNGAYRCLVRGRDMDEVPALLAGVRFFVTYCGSTFDVPVLRNHFGPGILAGAAHLDLMHTLHAMGIRGGLKASERSLGLARPATVDGLSGDDAVRLWRHYRSGDAAALATLIAYNREDVLNLERILDIVAPRLAAGLGR
ncbi:MAG: ribonuclease H-like domain-containing protein [Planctomycetes bacterium]|nr:ribonuclease H-like domain-containing protein [Planctomycetota bacterium]